jgi:hypothetical protein
MIFLFDKFIHKGSIVDFSFSLLAGLIIFLRGSRGPLLALIFYLFIMFIISVKNRDLFLNKRKIFFFLGFIVVSLLIVPMSIIFRDILLHFDISSRTLESIINGSILQLSDRDVIIEEMILIINNNPLFGIGLLGDLRSHNILVENVLFYGYPIGLFLNFFLIVILFLVIKLYDNSHYSRFLIVLMSYAIIDSLLNLTIIGKDIFWIFLGLSINYVYSKVVKNKNQKFYAEIF